MQHNATLGAVLTTADPRLTFFLLFAAFVGALSERFIKTPSSKTIGNGRFISLRPPLSNQQSQIVTSPLTPHLPFYSIFISIIIIIIVIIIVIIINIGRKWTNISVILVSFWWHFCVILVSSSNWSVTSKMDKNQCHFCVILVTFLCHFDAIVIQFRYNFDSILTSFWCHFGVILVSF